MDHTKTPLFIRGVEKTIEVAAVLGFIGMLLATGGQVLFRYVLRISVPWTEELARILFILSMFLGMALAIRGKEHIVVDFLFKKLSPRGQAIGRIVFDAAILLLLLILARGTITMTRLTWNSYMIALDWVRTGYLYMGELLAIVFMMFYVVLEVLEDIRALRSRRGGNVMRR